MRNQKKLIIGDQIYLRKIKLSDVDDRYCKWMNNPKVNQYLESRFQKWTVRNLKGYVREIKNNPDYLFLAIIEKKESKHIGNVKIGPINKVHRFAEIGIIIGEESFWGKGFASEAIRLVIDYSFNVLNLHKLTAGAYENNIASIKAFEKAGFSEEGRRRNYYLYKDEYVDSVLLGIERK